MSSFVGKKGLITPVYKSSKAAVIQTGAEPGHGVGKAGHQGEQSVSRAYRDADGGGELQAGSEFERDMGEGEYAGTAVDAGRVPGARCRSC